MQKRDGLHIMYNKTNKLRRQLVCEQTKYKREHSPQQTKAYKGGTLTTKRGKRGTLRSECPHVQNMPNKARQTLPPEQQGAGNRRCNKGWRVAKAKASVQGWLGKPRGL